MASVVRKLILRGYSSSVQGNSFSLVRSLWTSMYRLHDATPPENNACGRTASNNPVKAKTPIGKLDELEEGKHPYQEKQPLPEFPDGVNPATGEIGGPRGPEPTRYGDWERKGRVTDF